MKKLYLLTLLTTVFALPIAASANNPEKIEAKADHYFSKADTNNDGFISEEEHQKASDDKFNHADANKDGKISRDEFTAHKKSEKAGWKGEKSSKRDNDVRASDHRDTGKQIAPSTPRNNGSAM